MALPDPVTRKEMYLSKAASGSGNVPPEPVTREEMYLAEIAKGGGSGGATSLKDLSDVKITGPTIGDTLVYRESPVRGWFNSKYNFSNLSGISSNAAERGVPLLNTRDSEVVFDYYQCAESINYNAEATQAFMQIISLLKTSAKASGKVGTKVSTDAAGMLSQIANIADKKKRIPIAKFGDYEFCLKGRISTNKMLFSCADTDADGLYDITVAIDSGAGAIYITVEYTACPAMG